MTYLKYSLTSYTTSLRVDKETKCYQKNADRLKHSELKKDMMLKVVWRNIQIKLFSCLLWPACCTILTRLGRSVCLRQCNIHTFVFVHIMTLTFDIWPWKTFQQFPIFVVSVHDVTIFVEINPLIEIASWEFFMDGQQTDGRTDGRTGIRPENTMPLLRSLAKT